MKHKNKTRRILSWLLALCIALGTLPLTAFAVSNEDDPTTWPAPDSSYTADGHEPMYLFVDYSDEENGGIGAFHNCTSSAELVQEVVKATATSGGYVKFSCSLCGTWARIDIPALTLDAFTLDPAYLDAVTNGVEYSGDVYTVVYNVVPEWQRYVGASLTNNAAVDTVSTYSFGITIKQKSS